VSFNIYFSIHIKTNFFIVSNINFIFIVGIVDVLFTVSSIKMWGMSTQKGESFFFFLHFLATNDDNHTTFQLLATKVLDEVVTTRLTAFIEYGMHNALP
jgi:hypothetical protein